MDRGMHAPRNPFGISAVEIAAAGALIGKSYAKCRIFRRRRPQCYPAATADSHADKCISWQYVRVSRNASKGAIRLEKMQRESE